MGGPERLSLREVIAVAEKIMHRRSWHPSVPLWLAKFLATSFLDPLSKLGVPVPVGGDAIQMLDMPIVCSDEELARTIQTFGIELTPLEAGLRRYLAKK
ncbi:MAG: hypothetical protein ACR2HJ_11220 [Fimbriimonadales bacterium]